MDIGGMISSVTSGLSSGVAGDVRTAMLAGLGVMLVVLGVRFLVGILLRTWETSNDDH